MQEGRYSFGEFSIAPGERQVFQGTRTIPLPPKTFDVLHLLVRNHGDLVSRSQISATIWPDVHVTDANLTNIVVALRKILGRDSIQTVSKFGYRFTLSVTGEPGVKQVAYASFVRGKELLQHRSPDSIQRARDLFWFCLAQDPQFAPAWAWFGRACRLLVKFCNGATETPDLAEAAFQRAFAIDPDLACAHYFYTQLQMDSGRALQAMTRLASRLTTRGEDPELWPHWCRSCAIAASSMNPSSLISELLLSIPPSGPASPILTFCRDGTRTSLRTTSATTSTWTLPPGLPWERSIVPSPSSARVSLGRKNSVL